MTFNHAPCKSLLFFAGLQSLQHQLLLQATFFTKFTTFSRAGSTL